MNNRKYWIAITAIVATLFPIHSYAQTFAGEIHSMQSVLDQLYEEMIPLCNQMISIGRGIAGFAALWYIASRVWRHIANAEPIDFYPLLRPFAIGLAILMFPSVLALMNAVLKPTVTGTSQMVTRSNVAIAYLLEERERAIQKTTSWQLFGDEGTHGKWYKYENPDGQDEDPDMLSNGIKFLMAKTAYGLKNMIKQWLSQILEIVYESAALCINTLRTFYLIVLAILGPLVFGFAVFDGLQNTLTAWIARYINVYLWLPVANIFGAIIGKIQENMLKIDLAQIEKYGDTFFSSADTAYIIFLIIGIVGYFTVPSVAGYIVHAGGSNVLLHKATNLFAGTVASTASTASSATGALINSFKSSPSTSGGSPSANTPSSNGFMHDKLSGNKS